MTAIMPYAIVWHGQCRNKQNNLEGSTGWLVASLRQACIDPRPVLPFLSQKSMKCRDLEQIFAILHLHPKREHRFHGKRRWRFDYAFPDRKIAVEYEGVCMTMSDKSRHTTITGYSNDCEKYNEAAMAGWKVLRFTAVMLSDGRAFEQIERALRKEVIA